MTTKKDDFFPEANYKIPTASNYMKFVEGDNTFRVLSSAVVGWEYWNTENKPIRNKENWNKVPEDIKMDKEGNIKISHFWAFVVWNYNAKKVQILEITQKGIMNYMEGLIRNPKWGSPKGYDITVNRTGSGLNTEYTAVAEPHSPVDEDIIKKYGEMNINLEALFTNEDPFVNF